MVTAVIVAAGRGTRFGPDQDKLFLELAGRPVVGHTWCRFDAHPEFDHVVLVVRPALESAFRELGTSMGVKKPYTLVGGGKERQDSVWNGIEAAPSGTRIVAIHDGARPCASAALLTQCIAAAREHGAAVASQAVTDTIKMSVGGQCIDQHLDRSRLWSVQTPQAFQLEIIKRALGEVKRRGLQVTDDTAACETIGQAVRLVVSNDPNPKVTLPQDLPWVELLLSRELAASRKPR